MVTLWSSPCHKQKYFVFPEILVSKYSALFQSINVRGLPDGFSRTGRSSADMKALFFSLSSERQRQRKRASVCWFTPQLLAAALGWVRLKPGAGMSSAGLLPGDGDPVA